MKRSMLLGAALVFMGGCATYQPSLPKGYEGPVAFIQDSAEKIDGGKSDMFYLAKINGGAIFTSRQESASASVGQGNYLNTVLLDNRVPAESGVFTIVGRTVYAMPIRAMTGKVYVVEGDVAFSPEPGVRYIIEGKLSEEKSEVWIRNTSSGDIVEAITVEGSSK